MAEKIENRAARVFNLVQKAVYNKVNGRGYNLLQSIYASFGVGFKFGAKEQKKLDIECACSHIAETLTMIPADERREIVKGLKKRLNDNTDINIEDDV